MDHWLYAWKRKWKIATEIHHGWQLTIHIILAISRSSGNVALYASWNEGMPNPGHVQKSSEFITPIACKPRLVNLWRNFSNPRSSPHSPFHMPKRRCSWEWRGRGRACWPCCAWWMCKPQQQWPLQLVHRWCGRCNEQNNIIYFMSLGLHRKCRCFPLYALVKVIHKI